MFCYIHIVTDQIMKDYTRIDLSNFADIEPIRILKVKIIISKNLILKSAKLVDLKAEVERRTGISYTRIRFWKWEKRQNRTYRPDAIIKSKVDDNSVRFIFIF
jgi:hypothetical protein